ncbi:hypothetical protein [Winogradskyella psychrotolerans]|uniref:hypothetical protein n=1 Tax=Winogradskyella psychrotolerans TaxID=1344585 RepID=UPI001C06DA6D|nr:hypothetical protein [Winogradskyella psychrotolerans]MBU2930216.1 hypothetical protein [Winogradskyella psychrotolerans]
MKNSKFLTALLFMSVLVVTSCQDEIDNENGDNPNTNSANSTTASNLERSAMYDGSFDDFLDGMSCSSVLLPVTATINNTQVTLVTSSDYSLVLDIIGEFTDDDDSVQFQFPLTAKLSNYTEVLVANQSEFDALIEACENAENEAENAINCLNIDFPITILTYDVNVEQTGSVVIESEQQLYAYINNFDDTAFFAVNYPITATLNSNTAAEITSDADLQSYINECLTMYDDMEDAEEDAEALEDILVSGLFTIDTFVTAGIDTANDFSEFTLNFGNDLTITAENTVNAAISDVNGTYEVASELDIFLSLTFSQNANFELLNNTWEVTSYSESTISLRSTTNAAVTLVLTQI